MPELLPLWTVCHRGRQISPTKGSRVVARRGSSMANLAELQFAIRCGSVRPPARLGGTIAAETPVQRARKIAEEMKIAKAKSLARVSSRVELMAAEWKGRWRMPEAATNRTKPEEEEKPPTGGEETTRLRGSGRQKESRASGSAGPGAGRKEEEEHPWRPGTAVRLPYRRGSKRGLDNVKNDSQAIERLNLAKFARSALASMRSRAKWWVEICRPRGWSTVPVTKEKLVLAGALLKEGGYRSACLYLASIKRGHVQAGYAWTEQLALEMSDVKRAVLRGRGPDRQADPLPLHSISKLPKRILEKSRNDDWPAAGRDAAVVCCAWLCREVEASTAFEDAVTLHPGEEDTCGWAEWDMPASKADWLALGKVRALSCACPSLLCPVAAMRRVKLAAERANHHKGPDAKIRPLLPKVNGDPLEKKEMTAFFVDLEAAVGKKKRRITGHSARVTGAMRMAFGGHSLYKIKVFGRWGSDAVERYVREAILGKHGGDMAKITEGVKQALTKELQTAKGKRSKAKADKRRRTGEHRRRAASEEE